MRSTATSSRSTTSPRTWRSSLSRSSYRRCRDDRRGRDYLGDDAIVVSGRNFGIGSSLGHVPLAMIVRDAGGAWQVVLQTDHADLSAEFARQWAAPGARHESLIVAAGRHDDGWAVWERAPGCDESGKPVNFLDVDVRSHLAFYRAGIAAITEHDPYAGLLVSMHGAGIYRQRYGLDPGLSLTRSPEVQDLVEAFVAEQEATFGGDPGAHRADYDLLQLYDRLSLYFCMRDVEAGEAAELQGYRLEPVEPWHVRIAPYPFVESPARFSLLRRLVPKQPWTQAAFRHAFPALIPERIELTVERSEA